MAWVIEEYRIFITSINTDLTDFCISIQYHRHLFVLRIFEIAFPPMDNQTSHEAVSQPLGKLLSPFLKLTILAIPICCMTEELFTTLSRLPNLEDLSLLPWVLDFHKIYAEDLPERQLLGLTLSNDLEFPDLKMAPPPVKFSLLTLLNVGNSTLIPDIMMEVSMFLSIICGKSLKIKSGDEAASMWIAVEKMVVLQLKNWGLEDEIALLRTRIEEFNIEGV
ncbi:hypothetical protein Clacol_002073 [Clathrus columnatus]|uniref:HAT C-terminal dimerisation domain-containing protein n=1 Tax=Clathrus columnatus TaxID=1419009 RepID=A0AAV5A2M2_9AGAM|nr:hypothetical protein Clacol_002073 [Clathrus columnatus]